MSSGLGFWSFFVCIYHAESLESFEVAILFSRGEDAGLGIAIVIGGCVWRPMMEIRDRVGQVVQFWQPDVDVKVGVSWDRADQFKAQ